MVRITFPQHNKVIPQKRVRDKTRHDFTSNAENLFLSDTNALMGDIALATPDYPKLRLPKMRSGQHQVRDEFLN